MFAKSITRGTKVATLCWNHEAPISPNDFRIYIQLHSQRENVRAGIIEKAQHIETRWIFLEFQTVARSFRRDESNLYFQFKLNKLESGVSLSRLKIHSRGEGRDPSLHFYSSTWNNSGRLHPRILRSNSQSILVRVRITRE